MNQSIEFVLWSENDALLCGQNISNTTLLLNNKIIPNKFYFGRNVCEKKI